MADLVVYPSPSNTLPHLVVTFAEGKKPSIAARFKTIDEANAFVARKKSDMANLVEKLHARRTT